MTEVAGSDGVALNSMAHPQGVRIRRKPFRKTSLVTAKIEVTEDGEVRYIKGSEMTYADSISGDLLRSFVERIERLSEEKQAISDDIKDVYLELKGGGFDPVIVRQIVRLRKQNQEEIDEQETLLTLYKRALKMIPDEPEE